MLKRRVGVNSRKLQSVDGGPAWPIFHKGPNWFRLGKLLTSESNGISSSLFMGLGLVRLGKSLTQRKRRIMPASLEG